MVVVPGFPNFENWFKTRGVSENGGANARYAKSADTRARILAAELEEAGKTGLHHASVARIAARAGLVRREGGARFARGSAKAATQSNKRQAQRRAHEKKGVSR